MEHAFAQVLTGIVLASGIIILVCGIYMFWDYRRHRTPGDLPLGILSLLTGAGVSACAYLMLRGATGPGTLFDLKHSIAGSILAIALVIVFLFDVHVSWLNALTTSAEKVTRRHDIAGVNYYAGCVVLTVAFIAPFASFS